MAWARKRKSDRARGKSGKWTAVWRDENNVLRSKAYSADRALTLKYAQEQEARAVMIRTGMLDAREERRRQAGLKPLTQHLEDYRLTLTAKANTDKHVKDVIQALTRLLADASAESISDLEYVRVSQALGRLRAKHSARLANKYRGYLAAFTRWLADAGRIAEAPRWIAKLTTYSVDADTSAGRRIRRALAPDELERLYAAAEQGGPFLAYRGPRRGKRAQVWLDGPTRAILYRLAAGTGFRAQELASLTPESFVFGDRPTVTVRACYAKNGQTAVQVISRSLAARVQPFVATCQPGAPLFRIPHRTAKMLALDLRAAGIDPVIRGEVADFHALRASYVTNLLRKGEHPGVVQKLARHSDPRLTMNTYNKVNEGDLREAIEE